MYTESYRIINVRGNSVRVSTGGVSFDVLVHEDADGKCTVEKPRIYVHDFAAFRRAVVSAYRYTKAENAAVEEGTHAE